MKKILNIALATAFAFTLSGCNDFLDTSSSSVVDRDFVFSNEDSARDALYYGYETLRANRSLHSTGFFWHPVWGSDIEDSQDTYNEGSAGILHWKYLQPIITQYFIDNKSEIWLLFLIAHSKR